MSAPFLILAVITLLSACAAMALRQLVHCALALALTFAGIAALYINFDAEFLGLAQLLVYVGAVAVLIVFVILLTRGGEQDAPLLPAPRSGVIGTLLALAVFAVFARAVLRSDAIHATGAAAPHITTRGLGSVLMQSYVFPLEVIGLLLTAAMIGAVIVAMKEKPGS